MLLENQRQSVGMFGERLRREREMRGVSLDEIAHATKIGTRLLRALEEEQFDLLPGGIFNKGFVRAYAKYLGIDEEQAVADYMQAAGESELDLRELAQSQPDAYGRTTAESPQSSRFPVIPVVILLLVVGAGFGGWKLYQQYNSARDTAASESPVRSDSAAANSSTSTTPTSSGSTAQPSAAQPTVSSPTPAPADSKSNAAAAGMTPTAPAKNTSPTGVPESAGNKFQIAVHTTGPAWVSIKADGKIAVRGIVPADQTKTVQANDEVVLWTGNAGVTQVTFNGNPVPVPGGVNEVKLLVFKANGLQPTPPSKPPADADPAAHRTVEPATTPQ